MSIQQRLIVAMLDVLVLIELAACMFWANRNPQALTTVFLSTYLPMAFGTLLVGKIWIRKVQAKAEKASCPDTCT